MSKTITDTEPASPEDVANAEVGDRLYIEFEEAGAWGIRAIDGKIIRSHTNEMMEDHARTVMVRDLDEGTVDFILVHGENGIELDAGVEADSHYEGVTVWEIESVETIEIHPSEE